MLIRHNLKKCHHQLAEKTGIAQSDISRIENGNANPSLKTIERIASGMGMTLRVEFVPAKQAD